MLKVKNVTLHMLDYNELLVLAKELLGNDTQLELDSHSTKYGFDGGFITHVLVGEPCTVLQGNVTLEDFLGYLLSKNMLTANFYTIEHTP